MIKNLLWFQRCITYYNYRWQVKIAVTPNTSPEFAAVASSSVCLLFNLVNLNFILKYLRNKPIINFEINTTIVVIFSFFLLYLNYKYLMQNGKFENIKKEFENCSQSEDRRRKIMTVVYTLSTFILFFVLIIATGRKYN